MPERIVQQYNDNLRWLSEAEKHKMVVGSQARILYSDQEGRVKIALAFNNAVKNGIIKVYIIHIYKTIKLSVYILSWFNLSTKIIKTRMLFMPEIIRSQQYCFRTTRCL